MQEEEIEALRAIYGEEFCMSNSRHDGVMTHQIAIHSEAPSSKRSLSLILMVCDYQTDV